MRQPISQDDKEKRWRKEGSSALRALQKELRSICELSASLGGTRSMLSHAALETVNECTVYILQE